MRRLAGRVALVTGGNRGIGRAICERLVAEGSDLVINYHPGEQGTAAEAEALAAQLSRGGRRVIMAGADVADGAQVQAMAAAVLHTFDRLDILVNNAGIAPFSPFLEVTEQVWDRIFAVNVKGIFLCCRAFAPSMIDRRYGKIVNVASTASVVAIPNLAPYCASKAAVKMLTHALALELGRHDVNVNAVGPSTTPTRLTAGYLSDPDIRRQEEAANPLKRLGRPEDIAAAVAYLASDDARQVNGHLLMVDGGLTVRSPQPEPV